MEAFVYCWTDHLTNKLYVGSRKGNPDDGYICSSKIMKEEYQNRPQDFSRTIVAEGFYIDMRMLEAKILQSIDAAHDSLFYNLQNQDGKFRCNGHSKETRIKLSKSHTGKIRDRSSVEKVRQAHIGAKRSDEARQRMSDGQKKRIRTPHSEETKRKMSESMKGKKHKPYYGRVLSEESKQKMRESLKKYNENKKKELNNG